MPTGIDSLLMNSSHFLEEVPVHDHLEFLQNEVDPVMDEEGLVCPQSLRQQQQVALTTCIERNTQNEEYISASRAHRLEGELQWSLSGEISRNGGGY